MEAQYRTWYKIQVISCICFVFFLTLLYWMIFIEFPYMAVTVVTAVIATASEIITFTSGFIRAIIGYKIGIKSTKKDWLITGIVFMLVIIYFAIRYIKT